MHVERPHWFWWALIQPAILLLVVLSCSSDLFDAWAAATRLPLPQVVYKGLLVFTVVMHVSEGIYAFVLARGSSEADRAAGWGVQTLLMGIFSLRLLLRRVKQANVLPS